MQRNRGIVCIISEQAIPNILYIKEILSELGDDCFVVFITTKEMERLKIKDRIIKICNIDSGEHKRYESLMVEYDDVNTIRKTLKEFFNSTNIEEFYLNLTGGTKLMTLSIYEEFLLLERERPNVIVHYDYLPANKNIIYSFKENKRRELKVRISIREYFEAYGYAVTSRAKEETLKFKVLQELLDRYIKILLGRHRFPISPIDEKIYENGKWFEDYLYEFLKRSLKRSDIEIGRNFLITKVNLSRKDAKGKISNDNDNELDIVLMKNNKIYIFELKSEMPNKRKRAPNYGPLYKLIAITKDKGIMATAIFVSLRPSDVNNNAGNILKTRQVLKRRAQLLGIKLLTLEHFTSNRGLLDELKDLLK